MNKVFVSGYSSSQSYVNNEPVHTDTTAFRFDGKDAEILSNKDGEIQYKKLNKADLMKLINVDYHHETPLMERLETLVASSKGKSAKASVKKTSKSKSKKTSRATKGRKQTQKRSRKASSTKAVKGKTKGKSKGKTTRKTTRKATGKTTGKTTSKKRSKK